MTPSHTSSFLPYFKKKKKIPTYAECTVFIVTENIRAALEFTIHRTSFKTPHNSKSYLKIFLFSSSIFPESRHQKSPQKHLTVTTRQNWRNEEEEEEEAEELRIHGGFSRSRAVSEAEEGSGISNGLSRSACFPQHSLHFLHRQLLAISQESQIYHREEISLHQSRIPPRLRSRSTGCFSSSSSSSSSSAFSEIQILI